MVTLICFALQFPNFAKFFNDWQQFESSEPFIAVAMARFAKRARLVEYAFMAFMVVTWGALVAQFSISDDPSSTGCTQGTWWDMACAVSKNVIRVFSAHFLELYLVYLILCLTTCFEALKSEITETFRLDPDDLDTADYLIQKIAQAKRVYLELYRFAGKMNALFNPQLLVAMMFLIYFCVSALYLTVILASFGGHAVEIVLYGYVFLEVTARIVACSVVGHALYTKVRLASVTE